MYINSQMHNNICTQKCTHITCIYILCVYMLCVYIVHRNVHTQHVHRNVHTQHVHTQYVHI